MNDVQQLIVQLKAKGWTRAAIADEMGLAPYTLERWEKGVHSPANAAGVALLLERLLKRRRIPKKKRYIKKPSTPRG